MSTKDLPLLTIGMLTKNRAWCITRVLKSIEVIDYPKEKIKIIFVDDYSTDGTYEIVRSWAREARAKGLYKVEIIRARTNIPQARNLCVKRMEGKYLLFWDSDVIPPPGLLREMVEVMERSPDVGIIGADYMYESFSGIKYEPTTNKETHAVYMGFTLIRREVFEKAGLFNENLSVGEDTEFCIRVKEKTGYRILWASKPVLHLKRPEDVKKLNMLRVLIWYNFIVRAKEYYNSWGILPKFLKLRIVYWLAWPWLVILFIYAVLKSDVFLVIFSLAYLFASAYFVVKQKGLLHGIGLWAKNNVLIGLSLSYGIVKEFAKTLSRKLLHKDTL